MNRQSRRAALGSVTAGAMALAIAGCASTVANIGSAAASGAMTAIMLRVQAVVTTFNAAATALGSSLSVAAQDAIAKVVSAGTTIADAVTNGAAAVANATQSSGISGLASTAGKILLGLINLVPGLSTFSGIIQDAISVAPTVIAYATSILNPTAVGAPNDGGAARRLGVLA